MFNSLAPRRFVVAEPQLKPRRPSAIRSARTFPPCILRCPWLQVAHENCWHHPRALRLHAVPGQTLGVNRWQAANVVKVVVNRSGAALYFSRRTIPCLREAASGSVSEQLAAFPFLKHLGIYGCRRETLLRLVRFPASPLELAEKLEQLRALENGTSIAVVQVNYDSLDVAVPADVARVEQLLIAAK
jgi:CMP-2-keto-3-deoxyoctulosonic acid synthetase